MYICNFVDKAGMPFYVQYLAKLGQADAKEAGGALGYAPQNSTLEDCFLELGVLEWGASRYPIVTSGLHDPVLAAQPSRLSKMINIVLYCTSHMANAYQMTGTTAHPRYRATAKYADG